MSRAWGRLLCALLVAVLTWRNTSRVDTVLVQHPWGLRCVCNDWELVRYQYGYVLDTLMTGQQSRHDDAMVDGLRVKYFWMWGEKHPRGSR